MSIKIMSLVWELDLPQDLKLIALAFSDHADDNGICYPSLARVAWKSGYSKRSVQRKVAALSSLGLLESLTEGNRGPGHPVVYRVVPTAVDPLPDFISDLDKRGANLSTIGNRGDKPGKEGVTKQRKGGHSCVTQTVSIEPSVEPSVGEEGENGDLFPSPPIVKKNGKVKKKKISLPANWRPTEEHRVSAKKVEADLESEVEKFRAHASATGRLMVCWNGAFALWLLNSKKFSLSGNGNGNGEHWAEAD